MGLIGPGQLLPLVQGAMPMITCPRQALWLEERLSMGTLTSQWLRSSISSRGQCPVCCDTVISSAALTFSTSHATGALLSLRIRWDLENLLPACGFSLLGTLSVHPRWPGAPYMPCRLIPSHLAKKMCSLSESLGSYACPSFSHPTR